MEIKLKFQVVNGNIIIAREWLSEDGWKHELLNSIGKIHDGMFDDKFWGHKKALPRIQFTGIQDSEGRDVYDGYIIEGKFMGSSAKQKKIVYWDESIHGWRFPNGMTVIISCKQYDFKIVGNIYENRDMASEILNK